MKDKLIELLRRSIVPEYMVQPLAEFLEENGVALPVRCGECEHYSAYMKDDKYGVCRYWQYYTEAPEVCADEFCCHGERRAE